MNIYGKIPTRSFQIKATSTILQAAFPYVSPTQSSNGYPSFMLIVDSTARTGGTSITASIESYNEASQAWETSDVLTGAAITTADTLQNLIVSPLIVAAANAVAARPAPRLWRVRVIETGTITSAAFSLGVVYF